MLPITMFSVLMEPKLATCSSRATVVAIPSAWKKVTIYITCISSINTPIFTFAFHKSVVVECLPILLVGVDRRSYLLNIVSNNFSAAALLV